jgi:uncharacterized membrane-anchored protein YhcB (DUF1043 family)
MPSAQLVCYVLDYLFLLKNHSEELLLTQSHKAKLTRFYCRIVKHFAEVTQNLLPQLMAKTLLRHSLRHQLYKKDPP